MTSIRSNDPAPAPPACGLDKLDLAIPPNQRFTTKFEAIQRQLARFGMRKEDYHPHWPFVVLHPPPLYTSKASRILQFSSVRNLNADAILRILREVVLCDPLELRISRIDVTADMFGHSIQRWRNSMKVRKLQHADYRNPNYITAQSKSGRYESLYFGSPKSNNYIRGYDKAIQLAKEEKVFVDLQVPWTRFERVYQRGGIPAELDTLGGLFTNGATHDPFGGIEIASHFDTSPESIFEMNPSGFSLNELQNAAWTLWAVQCHGRTGAVRYIRSKNRKPKEMFALLDRVLATVAVPMPSPADLTARYQQAFTDQLFGHLDLELPLDEATDAEVAITIPVLRGELP